MKKDNIEEIHGRKPFLAIESGISLQRAQHNEERSEEMQVFLRKDMQINRSFERRAFQVEYRVTWQSLKKLKRQKIMDIMVGRGKTTMEKPRQIVQQSCEDAVNKDVTVAFSNSFRQAFTTTGGKL